MRGAWRRAARRVTTSRPSAGTFAAPLCANVCPEDARGPTGSKVEVALPSTRAARAFLPPDDTPPSARVSDECEMEVEMGCEPASEKAEGMAMEYGRVKLRHHIAG